MEIQDEKQFFKSSIVVPIILVMIMLLVEIVEAVFHLDFSFLGIKPLSAEGLPGILLFHFLHGDWEHLFANSIPILVLGTSLYYFYKPIANKILLILMLSTGLITWCLARSGVHIGASALVYGLTFFLMLSGFIRREKKTVIISLIVVFLYGSLVWGLYPKYAIENNISWEGHLSGFVMGIVLAFFYKNEGPQREEHVWENEEEDKGEDENEGEKPYWDIPEPDKDELTIVYRFRK